MADKYKYHKQNEYPGERVAERKRVAEREEEADKKADARVAEKGRQNARLMESQRMRSRSRAESIHKSTDRRHAQGSIIIASLLLALVIVTGFTILHTLNQNNEIDDLQRRLSQTNNENVQLSAENNRLLGIADTTTPTPLYKDPVIRVSPENNELSVTADETITATFNKDMDPTTIDRNSFIVKQRLTPESETYTPLVIRGTVSYNSNTRQATFTPQDGLHANQVYGDVFTATLTTAIKDMNGNPLEEEYTWSFTTGRYLFNTGDTTSETN